MYMFKIRRNKLAENISFKVFTSDTLAAQGSISR